MRGRKSFWRIPGVLLVLLSFAAGVYAQGSPNGAVYDFEIPLAPVCLDGTFPVSVTTDGGQASGNLEVTTDAKGKLSGTLTLSGATYSASGKVSFKPTGTRLTLKAVSTVSKKNQVAFKGELAGDAFSGTTKGKGSVAAGKGTFRLDVSSAAPSVARFHVKLVTDEKGRITGTGDVTVCEPAIALKVSGKNGTKFKLKLSTKGFSFSGSGLPLSDSVVITWKAKGYGAKADGDSFSIPVLSPPDNLAYTEMKPLYEAKEVIPPNVPDASGGQIVSFSVSPALPTGLDLEPSTGVITGTPTTVTEEADYVVTAENVAGRTTATLSLRIRINRAESLDPQGGTLSDEDMRHFLIRTEFGVSLDSLDRLQKTKLGNYVDDILTFRKNTRWEKDAEANLVNEDDPEGLEGQFPSSTDLARWWIEIIARTENPFQEVMALFWHDHFATSTEVLSTDRNRWMVDHVNLWRHDGNGNYRDLLVSMARDWAMLRWLDGISNKKRAPNENFAREFWELFTLGVDNGYTQDNILEAARAFTGYRERYDEETKLRYIEFDRELHDPDMKRFFGRTIGSQHVTDDFEAVVDITLEERPAAEFICGKLFRHFCYDDPPDALIDEMAASFKDGNWELKPLMKKLLTSEAFFSKKSKEGHVKSPVEFGMGFIRTTGLQIRISSLDSILNDQAQRPTRPPTVDGWPEGAAWLSAQAMVQRANFILTCISDRTRQADAGIDVADILPPEGQRSAAQVVDAMAALLRVKLSVTDRADLIIYMNTERKSDGSTVESTFNGGDARHIDERVRGLLYVLAQHPNYQVR